MNYVPFIDENDKKVINGKNDKKRKRENDSKQNQRKKTGPKPDPNSKRQRKKRKAEQAKSALITINTPGKTKQGLITITDEWNREKETKDKRDAAKTILQKLVNIGVIVSWILQIEFWDRSEFINPWLWEPHWHIHIALFAAIEHSYEWWFTKIKKCFEKLLTHSDIASNKWLSLNADPLQCKLVYYCFKWKHKHKPDFHGLTEKEIEQQISEYHKLPIEKKFKEEKSPHVQKIPDEISKRWPSYFLMLVNYIDYYSIRYTGAGYFRKDKNHKFHKSDLLKTMGCDPHLYKWVSTGYRMFVKIIDSEDFALFWKKGHKLKYNLAWNKDQKLIQNPLEITENDLEF